jgi:diketogulonate reductase-like aldo/keto reductase
MDLMLHNDVTPAVNQIEVNPFLQQNESERFLRANRVQPEAWAPFAEGRNHIFENPALRAIATKHNKSVAQVILRWLSQRGIVVLSKSVRKERMAENFNVLDFDLSTDDVAAIATLDTGTSSFFDHRDPEKVKWLGSREIDV